MKVLGNVTSSKTESGVIAWQTPSSFGVPM